MRHAAIFLLLAGCFSPGAWPEGATWSDPELPGALAAQGVEPSLPPGILGIEGLLAVRYEAQGFELLELREGLYGVFDAGADAAHVRAALGWISDADNATLDRLARDMVDNGTQPLGCREPCNVVYENTVAVPQVNLSRALAAAPVRMDHHERVAEGPWTFTYALAVYVLERDGGRLEVTEAGHAAFAGLARGEEMPDAYEERVRSWLRAHGLPTPSSMEWTGKIA